MNLSLSDDAHALPTHRPPRMGIKDLVKVVFSPWLQGEALINTVVAALAQQEGRAAPRRCWWTSAA